MSNDRKTPTTPWKRERQAQRRKEAEQRQAEYDALTLEEKVERARSRRGNSQRELTRLNASVREEKQEKGEVVKRREKIIRKPKGKSKKGKTRGPGRYGRKS